MSTGTTRRPRVRHISTRNAAFQQLSALKHNRAKRTAAGLLVTEGVLPIEVALRHGLQIAEVYYPAGPSLSEWARAVIADAGDAVRYEVTRELMSEISDKDDGSELIVVARQPSYKQKQMAVDRVVILDRPGSPGNLGSIIRTCNGFGIDAVFISGHGADPYDPKCISASRGAVFGTPVVRLASNQELESLLARARAGGAAADEGRTNDEFVVFGSSAQGSVDLSEIEPRKRFALIVGNETTGMTRYLTDLADQTIRIPIAGDITSLNVACATSILLYQLIRGT